MLLHGPHGALPDSVGRLLCNADCNNNSSASFKVISPKKVPLDYSYHHYHITIITTRLV